MENFIHCRVSLEINNGQMGSSNASEVKLFAVKVTPNGRKMEMPTQVKFCYKMAAPGRFQLLVDVEVEALREPCLC